MRYALLLAALASAAACNLFEPSPSVRGQWGGSFVSLDARGSDVRLAFLCVRAVAPDLPIDGSGHFAGTAQVTGFGPSQLRLLGKLENAMVMTLDVASVWPPQGARTDTLITHQSYTLMRGVAPDFSGWACIA